MPACGSDPVPAPLERLLALLLGDPSCHRADAGLAGLPTGRLAALAAFSAGQAAACGEAIDSIRRLLATTRDAGGLAPAEMAVVVRHLGRLARDAACWRELAENARLHAERPE